MIQFLDIESREMLSQPRPDTLYFGPDFIYPDDDETLLTFIGQMSTPQLITFLDFVQFTVKKGASHYVGLVLRSERKIIEKVTFTVSPTDISKVISKHFVQCQFSRDFTFDDLELEKCSFSSCCFLNTHVFSNAKLINCYFDPFSSSFLKEGKLQNSIIEEMSLIENLSSEDHEKHLRASFDFYKNTNSVNFLSLPISQSHLEEIKSFIDHIAKAFDYPSVFNTPIKNKELVLLVSSTLQGREIPVTTLLPFISDPTVQYYISYVMGSKDSSLSYYEILDLFRALINSVSYLDRYSSYLKQPFSLCPLNIFVTPSRVFRRDRGTNDTNILLTGGHSEGRYYIQHKESMRTTTESGSEFFQRLLLPQDFSPGYFVLVRPNSVIVESKEAPLFFSKYIRSQNSSAGVLGEMFFSLASVSGRNASRVAILQSIVPSASALQSSISRKTSIDRDQWLYKNFQKTSILGLCQVLTNFGSGISDLLIPIPSSKIKKAFAEASNLYEPPDPLEEDDFIRVFRGTFMRLGIPWGTEIVPQYFYAINLREFSGRR